MKPVKDFNVRHNSFESLFLDLYHIFKISDSAEEAAIHLSAVLNNNTGTSEEMRELLGMRFSRVLLHTVTSNAKDLPHSKDMSLILKLGNFVKEKTASKRKAKLLEHIGKTAELEKKHKLSLKKKARSTKELDF